MIDDVNIYEVDDYGYPIIFQNPEIRKMFDLANAGANDIFYDLGCGWGQQLLIAKKEFNVKKVVGIEQLEDRFIKAKKRLKKWKISESEGIVIKGDYNDLFKGKIRGADIKEATIVFYGLGTDAELANNFKKNLRKGCKLLYYYNCLFPEIMPTKSNFPFFMSIQPFKETKKSLDWLKAIVPKKKSALNHRLHPSEDELWDELRHDYNVNGDETTIKDYKTRLGNL